MENSIIEICYRFRFRFSILDYRNPIFIFVAFEPITMQS